MQGGPVGVPAGRAHWGRRSPTRASAAAASFSRWLSPDGHPLGPATRDSGVHAGDPESDTPPSQSAARGDVTGPPLPAEGLTCPGGPKPAPLPILRGALGLGGPRWAPLGATASPTEKGCLGARLFRACCPGSRWPSALPAPRAAGARGDCGRPRARRTRRPARRAHALPPPAVAARGPWHSRLPGKVHQGPCLKGAEHNQGLPSTERIFSQVRRTTALAVPENAL